MRHGTIPTCSGRTRPVACGLAWRIEAVGSMIAVLCRPCGRLAGAFQAARTQARTRTRMRTRTQVTGRCLRYCTFGTPPASGRTSSHRRRRRRARFRSRVCTCPHWPRNDPRLQRDRLRVPPVRLPRVTRRGACAERRACAVPELLGILQPQFLLHLRRGSRTQVVEHVVASLALRLRHHPVCRPSRAEPALLAAIPRRWRVAEGYGARPPSLAPRTHG